ncbi:AAA family ATPase [Desulfosediminicola flagellatus]|uniref:AAA family ATPase n=1 Tax=Desulfosediminicola flagellatus TaxID=2569541 RepID=UPI00142ED069|nr:AAA family ATPase [Desulfosediminicola flagellatus]
MSNNETTLSVQLAIKTPDVHRDLMSIVKEMESFTLQDEENAAWADILVLEIGNDPATEFETIRLLVKEKVVGTLFLTSTQTTTDILLPAMRAGAREFFQQPIDKVEVREAFNTVLQKQLQDLKPDVAKAEKGRVLSVVGAKGGVGATTFAVNFATSIQAVNKDRLVALIDMNRFIGEIPLFLDLETDINWEEIGRNLSRLDASYLQSAMVRHSSGVFVLPAPCKLDSEMKLQKDFLYKLIRTMREFFDDIIVDCGTSFSEDAVKICRDSESIYLISTMSMPCIINVRKLQQSLASTAGVTNGRLQVVANRFEKKSQLSLAEASKVIGSEIVNTIPNDYSLTMSAVSSGKTVAEVAKRSQVAKAYRKLAESVCTTQQVQKSRFFGLFR